MDVTDQIRRLEAAGFHEETLDRAIAFAGASRLRYRALCQAVEERGMTPAEALRAAEAARG